MTSTCSNLDEEVEAILQQHRESAQQRATERGISTTVASLTKTFAKATPNPHEKAAAPAEDPPPAATKRPRGRPKKAAALPTSDKHTNGRKRKLPSEQSKWGIPTLKELQEPFGGDPMVAFEYLQQYGVLMSPPYLCPRCQKPLPAQPKLNKHSPYNTPEWRCRKAACLDVHQGKEWRRSFYYGSVFYNQVRGKSVGDLMQMVYFWCVLGVQKHHTTGLRNPTMPSQTMHQQIAILLGWTPESVCLWARRLRSWVSQYGLVDTSIERHGKKLGGPNTVVEVGILEVANIGNDETKRLLAGMERNSHGNFFVVRDLELHDVEQHLWKWIKPSTLVQTREDDALFIPTAFNHQLLEPETTLNQMVSKEMPKLYEDIWRRQNEGNLWFSLLDLLKLLRLANTLKLEQQQQEEENSKPNAANKDTEGEKSTVDG